MERTASATRAIESSEASVPPLPLRRRSLTAPPPSALSSSPFRPSRRLFSASLSLRAATLPGLGLGESGAPFPLDAV